MNDLDLIATRFERALAASPADETELVWTAVRTQSTNASGKARDIEDNIQTTLGVRVRERGRVGTHRAGNAEPGDIENAIRAALGQARGHEPLPGLPHLPNSASGIPPLSDGAFDPELAKLVPADAVTKLRRWVDRSELGQLRWQTGEFLVASSRGPLRRAQVTAAALDVRSGKGAGVGLASGAGRSLASLGAEGIVARARSRRTSTEPGAPPTGPLPVWLSPEATGTLMHVLARTAFTAHRYRDGSSFLRQHLGTHVFDRRLTLIDDGTDVAGMPFPFDLEGTAKRRVELIGEGTPRTPALDQRHAALFGLQATGHASGGDDARAENLFLLPGEASKEDLLAAAAGGIFVAALEDCVTHPPLGTLLRARARGVRAVTREGINQPLPDLVLEDSLLRALSHVLALGQERVLTSHGDEILGGVLSPALVTDSWSLAPGLSR
ncbi:MAG: metallopeptidase TldD-related protein [Acidobacteriota bacterium]